MNKKYSLDKWHFFYKEKKYATTIPSSILGDLQQHEIIENPFLYDNENKIAWVSDSDWTYICEFETEAEMLHGKNAILQFEQLDTYATIELNNQIIARHSNMFSPLQVNVSAFLQINNTLKVHFHAIEQLDEKLWKKPYSIDLPFIEKSQHRKAQMQFGWDFAPKMLTCGIGGQVSLIVFNDFHIQDIAIITNDLVNEEAHLTCVVQINNLEDRTLNVEFLGEKYCIEIIKNQKEFHFNFKIKNPKLWWCNGFGEPFLYKEQLLIHNTIHEIQFGIRTIKLIQNPENDHTTSFHFSLNGKYIFAKGANYVPANADITRIENDTINNLIQSCVEANFNMIRVWGGGIYCNNFFYKKCDENGILIWQDFMFACAMYPYENSFLESISTEAEFQVKRLRKHPCIALWCGNNEIDEAWHNWAWQVKYLPHQNKEIWNGYWKLFHEILPKIVSEHHSQIQYYPSSPKYSRFDKRSTKEGDSHYWGVWHDEEPFEKFWTEVPRFMSEYGFQSFPNRRTLRNFSNSNDIQFDDTLVLLHQKNKDGNNIISRYIHHYYPTPKNKNSIFYLSQLLQAEGISEGIKAHLANLPYCSGSLYWQLNDCWPAVSWSSIDFYGEWKALHYYAKKYFNPITVVVKVNDSKADVYLINTSAIARKVTLSVELYHYFGKEKEIVNRTIEIDSYNSLLVESINIKAFQEAEKYFNIRLFENGNIIFEDIVLLKRKKELHIPEATMEYTLEGNILKIKAESLIVGLYISSDVSLTLSDNFCHILPNSVKEIHIKSDSKITLESLSIQSFSDFVYFGKKEKDLHQNPITLFKKMVLFFPKLWRKISTY